MILTRLLGSDCLSLALDDEGDQITLNLLFQNKLRVAQKVVQQYQDGEHFEDEELISTIEVLNMIIILGDLFKNQMLSLWACHYRNGLNSVAFHRGLSPIKT